MQRRIIVVQAILLLHFYHEDRFVGQQLLWVELTSTGSLGTLIDLLARGCRPDQLYGTEQYPTASEAFKRIKHDLGLAYQNPYRPGDKLMEQATNIRVMQVLQGWPLEVPRTLM